MQDYTSLCKKCSEFRCSIHISNLAGHLCLFHRQHNLTLQSVFFFLDRLFSHCVRLLAYIDLANIEHDSLWNITRAFEQAGKLLENFRSENHTFSQLVENVPVILSDLLAA